MSLLRARGLTVTFGGVHAVCGVDLDIEAGAFVGLIGPNGAGKTTLIDAVTGFVPLSAGSVELDGTDITALTPATRAQRGLVRTFQSLELFEDLTVADNLRVCVETPRWWDPLVDAVRPRRGAEMPEPVAWALDVVGLADVRSQRPSELSHGRRKLVAVARALALQPTLVLLDEPAAGLDTAETLRLGEHLRRLPDHGISVLLVDHDMSLVLRICDRVDVLDVGAVIASGPPEQIRTDDRVIEAYLGVAQS
ncbi:MAG: ABC transporter ATP-binding protein [Acidimicrobiales bacterium]